MRALIATALAVAVLLTTHCGEITERTADAPRPARALTLALDFVPNPVHAGIYAAVADRADRARGVALRVRAPSASSDSLKLLTSGRAELAVVDIQDLGLARERGEDLVGVGALVQRPLAAVIARRPVRRPRDLEGRRVGVTGLPSDEAVVRALVEADGGDPARVRQTTIGFSAVPALASRRVAGVTAFWNAEGVALRERGVATREFRVGELAGPRYPELVLVARRETLTRDRERIAAAVASVRAGTEAALRDPGPALAAIGRASGGDRELERAQFDAVRPALEPAVLLDRAALEGWAGFATRFGILREPPDVDRAFDFEVAGGAR